MNTALFQKYRKLVAQTFVPIFAKDEYDTEVLLAGCDLAGVEVLEYTLRRDDAAEMLPLLKKRYPNHIVFVGSTIDDERIVYQMRRKYPQLMTVAELSPYVDGYVSMLPYTDETLNKYRNDYIMIPSAETSGEALRQIKSGATFIKVCGPDFSLSKTLHASPVFGYCPTFITGGVRCERMPEAFACGNLLCAAGFDVILSGIAAKELTPELTAERLRTYIETAKQERNNVFPALADAASLSDDDFINALPNYCGLLD